MANQAYLPFQRGKTRGHNQGTTADAAANIIDTDMEGLVVRFDDTIPASLPGGTPTQRSAGDVWAICVRNVSTLTLTPKHLVTWADGYRGKRVGGMSAVAPAAGATGEVAGVVDDQLAINVPVNHLFWLLVKGHALCKTGYTRTALGEFSAGDALVACTSNGTTNDDAGSVLKPDTNVATTALFNTLFYSIGRAVSSKTSNQTDSDVLVSLDLLKV